MRRLPRPEHIPMEVFAACVSDVEDAALQTRLTAITNEFAAGVALYSQRANTCQLFSIPRFAGNNAALVAGEVTKGELTELYSKNFVQGSVRPIYEAIRSLAPAKLCPQCGFGQIKNLDHYLPKAKFPLFSVLPGNLVPSCRDCNMDKLAGHAQTSGTQTIHPYYDANHFFEEQWIYARIDETAPPTIVFYAAAPAGWDEISKERVQAHFVSFNLSDRFSVQVTDELAALSNYLGILTSEEDRRQHLIDKALSYAMRHVNSWQTALTQALAANAWYCREGFSLQ